MKNRWAVYFGQVVYNVLCVTYLQYIDERNIGAPVLTDFILAMVNYTILQKIIQNEKDRFLFLFYSFGSITGTYIAMYIFKIINQ